MRTKNSQRTKTYTHTAVFFALHQLCSFVHYLTDLPLFSSYTWKKALAQIDIHDQARKRGRCRQWKQKMDFVGKLFWMQTTFVFFSISLLTFLFDLCVCLLRGRILWFEKNVTTFVCQYLRSEYISNSFRHPSGGSWLCGQVFFTFFSTLLVGLFPLAVYLRCTNNKSKSRVNYFPYAFIVTSKNYKSTQYLWMLCELRENDLIAGQSNRNH